ncbi:FtsW/RodA/SpoVE family cell cycle protein [Patulibacter sp. SYSU D01012]|uniref:FtsW/RodA/SpoVE family cell cycle protein n=1 Tax=Patulibacter sp. SYSU D01012 TaxID=2817381 RepID=UPI001B306E68|nr:FtsW/RodA/SpoVE family cell cycle protein [Patulibacter sp. SYSU D01012]
MASPRSATPLGMRVPRRRRSAADVVDVRLPFDPILALAAIGLSICSVVAVGGATEGSSFLVRQAIYATLGVGIAAVVSRLDYARWARVRWPIYGFMVASIVAVAIFGNPVNGSTLSIQLPFFSFQASELGKVLAAVVAAGFIVDRRHASDRWSTTAGVLLLVLLPAALTRDFGTSLVYAAIAAGVLVIGGAPGRHLAVLGVSAVVVIVGVLGVLPAAGVDVLKPYQVDRLTAFLNPNAPDDAGGIDPTYQLRQAKIAVGSGGKTGRGDEATQQKLDYLPESQTDFIFASAGERFGFVGVAAILSLYALIMWRGLRILSTARDFFGAVLAAGLLAMLLFQVLVNAGMNVGIMPITGIPLPLVSYGGSSVLSTYLGIGLLQAIYAQGRAAARRGPTVDRTD